MLQCAIVAFDINKHGICLKCLQIRTCCLSAFRWAGQEMQVNISEKPNQQFLILSDMKRAPIKFCKNMELATFIYKIVKIMSFSKHFLNSEVQTKMTF